MAIVIKKLNVRCTIKFRAEINRQIKVLIGNEKKKLGEIVFIFTDNSTILEINKKFLNHSYFTDVITFSRCKKDVLSGDIYISLDQVKINSREFQTTFNEEILRVMIHGILHLAGYNDKSDDEKITMREKEDTYLCEFKKYNLIT